MLSDVTSKALREVYDSSIVQQTAYWGDVKQEMGFGVEAIGFKVRRSGIFNSGSDTFLESDLLVTLQQLDQNWCYAYVPYGPELEPDDDQQGVFLEELSESLRSFLPENCIMIRYDLPWESYWAKDEDFYNSDGIWTGPPDKPAQEMRFNFNTQNWNFKKAVTNQLPSNTLFLDLKAEPEEILSRMRPKTRYNIGLSARKGVTVRACGLEELDVWYNLYTQTALRNGIFLHDKEYFRTVLEVSEQNPESPAEVLLLLAQAEGIPLAAMVMVVSGTRASYLYGASSSDNKPFMGSYAVQWAAIKTAREMGCTEYDMFGVAPYPDPQHPMYGLYRFKTGFGGRMFHSLGCWDYPLHAVAYDYLSGMELKSQGFHIN